MLENILLGLQGLCTIESVIFMILGTGVGILVGGIPGLTGSMTIALLIPLTYTMEPIPALAMLCGIYNGAIYGGSISAILFRIPGTPAACATVFDGYEMTKQGRSERALELAVSGSTFGGMFSVAILIVAAPALAKFALMFGPAEYFWVAVFGLSILVSLSEGSIIKGVISGLLGLFLSLVGMDPNTAVSRFVLEDIPAIGSFKLSTQLLSGFELVPILVGLFALPEVFAMLEHPAEKKNLTPVVDQQKEKVRPFNLFPKMWRTYLRSSIIGTIVGIIPAAGGNIASFISYGQAKRASKHPETYGHGEPDGVLASETANNAITGGSFVPLLALGIPGSTTTAVIMGAFMIQGINLGPQLFNSNPQLVYALMMSLLLTNIIMLLMGYYGSRLFRKSLLIPDIILAPVVMAFAVVGAYAIRNNMFDVAMLFFFGIVGYIMTKLQYPLAPLVLGLILGEILESNLLRALTISHGSIMGLFNSPISFVLIALTLFSLITGIRGNLKPSNQKPPEPPAS